MTYPVWGTTPDGRPLPLAAEETGDGRSVLLMAAADPATGTAAPAGTETDPKYVRDRNGMFGVHVDTDTTPATGTFHSITILEEATFSAFVEVGATGNAMTGFAIPAGVTIFGNITSFTHTSGKVRAYTS